MYSMLESGILIGVLIAHVDDLLHTWASKFITIAESSTKQFRTGEFGRAAAVSPITFTGLGIRKGRITVFAMSQKSYIDELPTMHIAGFAHRGNITNTDDMQTAFRHGLGALIRIHRARRDVGF